MGILGVRTTSKPLIPEKPRPMSERKKPPEVSEVELCKIIKDSNLFPGFRLHEEVGISGVSCDMIYENGNELYTIEAKTQLNFKVLTQACRWRTVASASFIAVPKGTLNSDKTTIIDELGLGVIVVDTAPYYPHAYFGTGNNPFNRMCGFNYAEFYIYPTDWEFWKPCIDRLGENLAPAGSKLGKRSTTFSRTIEALKLEAAKHPEYTLEQLLNIVPTHYSTVGSARQAIIMYAKQGIIEKFWHD